jgi:hypothetical protein
MDLFRIEAFVEDKNLARVKRLLTGLVRELRDEPIVNATVKGNKLAARTNGSVLELFIKDLQANKTASFAVPYIKEFLQRIGRSPQSSYYLIKEALKAGVIKRAGGHGVSTRFRVLPKRAAR